MGEQRREPFDTRSIINNQGSCAARYSFRNQGLVVSFLIITTIPILRSRYNAHADMPRAMADLFRLLEGDPLSHPWPLGTAPLGASPPFGQNHHDHRDQIGVGNAPAAATLSRTAHWGLSAFRPLRLVGIESICTTDDGRAAWCALYSSMIGSVMGRCSSVPARLGIGHSRGL